MNAVRGAGQPSLAQLLGGDHIRVKVKAELAEVKDHLKGYEFQGRIAYCIHVWYQEFTASLRHPDIQKVVDSFVHKLPDNFKNPLKVDAPFDIFGEEQPAIIRFMVQKMRDPKSLFYSAEVDAAGPAPTPDDLEEQMREIDAIWANRKQRANPETTRLGNLKQSLEEKLTVQSNHLAEMTSRIQKVFDEKTREKEALQKYVREEGEAIKATAKRLREEASLLMEETDQLRSQIKKLDADTADLKRANIELKIAINQVDIANREQKSGWLEDLAKGIASVAITYVLYQSGVPVVMYV